MKKFLMNMLLALCSVCATATNFAYYADNICIRNFNNPNESSSWNSCNAVIYVYNDGVVLLKDKRHGISLRMVLSYDMGNQYGVDYNGSRYSSHVARLKERGGYIYYIIFTKFETGRYTIALQHGDTELNYNIYKIEHF